MGRCCLTCALVAVITLSAATVGAQDERVRVSGTVSAGLGDGGPATAIGVAGGFRLAPNAGIELEVLYMPGQELQDQGVIIASQLRSTLVSLVPPGGSVLVTFPTPRVEINARTVAFLSSFVLELPVGRLRPYALFGGGIANVERDVSISFDGLPRPLLPTLILPASRYSFATNHLALTAGAGLDVRVWRRLSVAADVRYLQLLTEGTREDDLKNITRVGARASWWF